MSDTTTRPSFLDRMKEAAIQRDHERQEEFRRVADLVLGANRNRRRRVEDVVNIDGDYLVKVIDWDRSTGQDQVSYTTVVNGKANIVYHYEPDLALLHLIATRYDPNTNSNVHAAFYAARVLGIPGNSDED